MFPRTIVRGLVAAIVLLSSITSSRATVIFNDNFPARPDNQDIFGTQPSTAGPTVGTYAAVLTFPYGARVDPFTVMGKALKFNTSQGSDPQMLYLPYVYTYGTDSVRLSVTAAYDQFNAGGFNNFALGFSKFSLADGHNIFSEHVLIQNNNIQLHLPGTNILTTDVPFTFNVATYYTFALDYDPTLAGVAGQQPWTFSVNGTPISIPVSGSTVYDKLTMFEYVGFGGRFSNGNTTRYLGAFSLETGLPEPASIGVISMLTIAPLTMRRRRSPAR